MATLASRPGYGGTVAGRHGYRPMYAQPQADAPSANWPPKPGDPGYDSYAAAMSWTGRPIPGYVAPSRPQMSPEEAKVMRNRFLYGSDFSPYESQTPQQQSGPAISPGRGAGSQAATYSSAGGGGGNPRSSQSAASSPQDLGGPNETGAPDPYAPQPQPPQPQASQPQGPYSGPDIHGYPNPQYNPQYRVGGPSNRTFNPDLTTEDPARMAIQQRTMGWDVGNMQDQDYADEITNRGVQEGRYRAPMDAAFSQLWQNPGYTDQEKQDIIRQQGLEQYNLTPDQVNAFQLTPEEQAGITGNPGKQFEFYNPNLTSSIADETAGKMSASLDDWGNNGRGAYSQMSNNTRAAIARANLGPTQDYMDQQDAAQLAGRAGIRGAYSNPNLSMSADYAGMQDKYLGQGASGIRGAYNDPALNASSDYMQNMQFGPEAQQEMEQAAATSIGNNTRALRDRVDMAAAASGYNSPMAMASAHNQMQQQGDADAADALLDARVAAKRLGLDVTQRREDTRLGAAQNKGRMALSGEMGLMNTGVAAANARENTRLGAEQTRGRMQMQGESDLMHTGLAAAGEREGFRSAAEKAKMAADVANEQHNGTALMNFENTHGQAKVNAAAQAGGIKQQANLWNQETGVGIARDVDQKQSARAGQIATNRQGISMNGQQQMWGQNNATNTALSNRFGGVADARRTGQKEYRDWVTGQTGQNAQLKQSGMQGRTGLYGATMGATNNAVNTAAQFKTSNPSFGRTFGQGVASGLAKGVTGGWYGKG